MWVMRPRSGKNNGLWSSSFHPLSKYSSGLFKEEKEEEEEEEEEEEVKAGCVGNGGSRCDVNRCVCE